MSGRGNHMTLARDEATDPPGGDGRARVWGRCVSSLVVLCGVIPGILWCLEPWQRPGFLQRVPDATLLVLACLGIVGSGFWLGFRWKPGCRWRWGLLLCLCGFVLLGGVRFACGKLAVDMLESRVDRDMVEMGWSVVSRNGWIAKELVRGMEWMKWVPPKWLADLANRGNVLVEQRADRMVAASRWPVRRILADSMLSSDKSAEWLMREWKRYFPAIIGSDVDLECRKEWMLRLDALRKDEHQKSLCRQASLFCMALVLLTESEAFMEWRIPVRDAMIGWEHPLPKWLEGAWMRTIDALLAFDPPESWIELTKPLTTIRTNYRYAMALPVRGAAGHLDVLKKEFELFDSHDLPDYAFEFWLGADRSLEFWPDVIGEADCGKVQDWRRDVYFRWLLDGDYVEKNRYFDSFDRCNSQRFQFTPNQKQQLAAKTSERALAASKECEVKGSSPRYTIIENVRLILLAYPYLSASQQEEVSRMLVPVMLRPDIFKRGAFRLDQEWVNLLWHIQPLMDDQELRSLQVALRPIMEDMQPNDESIRLLLYLDAWSEMPVLSPEMWLAFAWQNQAGWRVVSRDTPHDRPDPFSDGPLPVPAVTNEAVALLAHKLETAVAGPDAVEKVLEREFFGDSSHSPRGRRISCNCSWNLEVWRSSGVLGSNAVPELLELSLFASGLRTLDDDQMRKLRQMVIDRKSPGIKWVRVAQGRSDLPDPWEDMKKDPLLAANQVASLCDDGWYFEKLLILIEKSPPDGAVLRAMWDVLRQRSKVGEGKDKTMIFGALFRLARWVPVDERLAMRRDFLEACHEGKVSPRPFDHDIPYEDAPPTDLIFEGGGLGIQWEDDALSAERSWYSMFAGEVNTTVESLPEKQNNAVFFHLTGGIMKEQTPPLVAPFEPTPWQRARELHLRRPDLEFR